MEHTNKPWIDEARIIAAQCWCDETTKHIEMDVALAEVVAQRIAAWMATGSQHAENESYWRDRANNSEQQRDELLAALEKIGGFTLSQFMGPHDMACACVYEARAAIAKVEAAK